MIDNTNEEGMYQFTVPITEIFLAVLSKNRPTINGHKMTRFEQKSLAVMLWTYSNQNMPEQEGSLLRKMIETRWPECNWEADIK